VSSNVRHRELSLKLAALTVGMFFFGFALVPLYDIFCDLTGLGGRTVNAAAEVEQNVDESRLVRVEFVASLGQTAPWEFRPGVSSMVVHPGQLYETHFFARNRTARHITGQAVPSVAPGLAARHFKKVECFCFTEQAFEPGEGRDMGVTFLIDPTLPAHLDTLTLSYTMYALPEPDEG
jgi:cytochrome c oxidase assembly protein subunit 11